MEGNDSGLICSTIVAFVWRIRQKLQKSRQEIRTKCEAGVLTTRMQSSGKEKKKKRKTKKKL
jgi:hypothetical protein